jgi:hypothetical protein
LVYSASGISFVSDASFSQVCPQGRSKAMAFSVECGTCPQQGTVYHAWTLPDGTPWLNFARTRDGYTLDYPSRATFVISADLRRITCYRDPQTSLDTVHHFWLDNVLPMLTARMGRFTLHASGVVRGGRAAAFFAPSGSGKSTLAAALLRAGCELIADDCVVIEQDGNEVRAVPSYPGLRLWPDSVDGLGLASAGAVNDYSEKHRVLPSEQNCETNSRPLHALYVLGPDQPELSITPLRESESFLEVVKSSFVLDTEDPGELRRHFESAAALVKAVPCYRLSYPRSFERLPSIARALAALAPEQ